MRVVRGKHQRPLGAVPFEYLEQVRGVFGLLQRLRCEPHVFPDVLAWGLGDPWGVMAQSFPGGIKPPKEGSQPRIPAFDEDNPQLGELLEDPLKDEAREMRHVTLGPHLAILDK